MISEDGRELLDIFAVKFQILHNNRLLNALGYDIGRGKGNVGYICLDAPDF